MKKYIIISVLFVTVCIIGAVGFVYQKVGTMLEEEVGERVSFGQVVHFIKDGSITSKEEESFKRGREEVVVEPISIYYPEKLSKLIPITTLAIESTTQNSELLLGTVNREPLDIFILASDKEMKEVNGSEINESTYYDVLLESISIVPENVDGILEDDNERQNYESQLSYEYAHYMFRQKLKNETLDFKQFPVWFYEGFAEYVANTGLTIEYSTFRVIPFDELITFGDWTDAGSNEKADISAQSYFAIKYLVSTFGDEIIYDIIEETKVTMNFADSLENKTGMTLEDLEYNFLTQYKHNK